MTDSSTAIELLSGRLYKKKYSLLVDCIHYVSHTMYDDVTYTKVRAHSGVPGNEIADRLARLGASTGNKSFELPIPSHSVAESVETNIYRNEFIHDCIVFL